MKPQKIEVNRQLLLCLGEVAEIVKALTFALLASNDADRCAKLGGLSAGLLREAGRLQEIAGIKPAPASTEAVSPALLLHAPLAPEITKLQEAPESGPLAPPEGPAGSIPPAEAWKGFSASRNG